MTSVPMERRTIMVVEIAEFSRHDRTAMHLSDVRSGFYDVLRNAFSGIGADIDT